MKVKSQDVHWVMHLVQVCTFAGAEIIQVSPDYILSTDELRGLTLEGNSLRFRNDTAAQDRQASYGIQEMALLLNLVYHEKHDVRPVALYNNYLSDFVIDFGKMYNVYEKLAKMEEWDERRRIMAKSNNSIAKDQIHLITEIVNRNIKRLCDIPGGYVYAQSWIQQSGNKEYRLPEHAQRLASNDYRHLTLNDLHTIQNRILKKKPQNRAIKKNRL
jgi:hypothetical protein